MLIEINSRDSSELVRCAAANDMTGASLECDRDAAYSAAGMSTAIYTLKVGKRLFRLAADAMRAHSIAVQRFEPLTATVLKGLEDFLVAPDQEAKVAKSLAFDEAGDIRISLRVQLSQREIFHAARLRICGYDPEPASVRLTLAVGLVCIFSTPQYEGAEPNR